MTNPKLQTASLALRQIMLAESATEWKPGNTDGAYIMVDGEWLYVSEQRIAEAEAEIRNGDEHPDLRKS